MLNIYYADALTDREKFIFDHIDPAKKTILIVPDQFSLQAEQDALRLCGKDALLELMVTDFSALGHKVVKETAGREPEIIDKYGRHMLLAVLIDRLGEELTVLRPRRSSNALADQMNTLISEMKRYEIGPEELEETIGRLKEEAGYPTDPAGRPAEASAGAGEAAGAPEEPENAETAGRPAAASADADETVGASGKPERAETAGHPAAAPADADEAAGTSEEPENAETAGRPAGAGAARGGYLILKLEDTLRIFRAYEDAIRDLYRDAEDYISYYAGLIPRSDLVRGSEVWIYGFDTFTPKNRLVIGKLLETAEQVNVVLTYEEAGQGEDRSPSQEVARAGRESVSDGSQETLPAGTAALRTLTQGGGTGLFRLTEMVMAQLEETAQECGQAACRERIEGYPAESIWSGAREAAKAGRKETQSVAADGRKAAAVDRNGSQNAEGPAPDGALHLADCIRLVQASGNYTEAESAAAFIQSLVRDEGYRYGDIAVLCNDMDGRGRMLRRAFERWDIPVFADQKRKVLHQPVVSFLLSFLEVLTDGFGGRGLNAMIKTGMMGWSMEDEELLENYITEFRIRKGRWQNAFTFTGGRYTDEQMQRLNAMRESLVSICSRARDSIGRRNTAEEKVRGLISFLQDDLQIENRIMQMLEHQQKLHLMEGAAETAQIWNAICGILEQIVRVIGKERISNALLREMIGTGLETLEIGLVPASADCVVMGTLQRTRPGRVRALVVTGANAGLLPLDMTEEGLLSRREKQKLEQLDLEFAGRERITQMEEQLAIYRMFSLPSERLYVSCSQSGDDGSMIRPSQIFYALQRWQPEVLGDLETRPFAERIGSRRATVPYLAEVLRERAAGNAGTGKSADALKKADVGVGTIETPDGAGEHAGAVVEPTGTACEPADASKKFDTDDGWDQVLAWYAENDPAQVGRLLRGIRFDNRAEALGDAMADALYRGDRRELEVSASRLEKYSGCPFAHFVQYGLRAQEQRLFEVGGREIGDVYHRCIMEFSRWLETASRLEASTSDAGSPAGNEVATVTVSGQATQKEDEGGTAEGARLAAPSGPTWQMITEEECRAQIARILERSAEDYREGLFSSDGDSRFRMERITEICGDVAWALVSQIRKGTIRRMYFEEPFRSERIRIPEVNRIDGKEVAIPEVAVSVGGRTVRIKGIIDRMDVIDAGEGHPEAIRIVDYKTGSNSIREEYFRTGYKLQLMVYMDAALHGSEAEPLQDDFTSLQQGREADGLEARRGAELMQDNANSTPQGHDTDSQGARRGTEPLPAGVFHFHIKDFNIDGDKDGIPDSEDPGDLRRRMQKFYRMEGIVVNDPAQIGAMDSAVDGSSKAESGVIPVKYDPKKEAYAATGGGKLLETAAFRELMEETNRQVERICAELYRGEIRALPKREKNKDRDGNRVTACRFCGFKSICCFDPTIPGCRYEDV